ncbi:IclR family transcriptional regulator [Streptacidiphilus jiangxiensis]|uniref:DNA-binding transcriptional regulator, IclR family n=1 Tax=Streptacidiphilus jiangxiensis TaxID=235985 RepID=A0A1H7QHU0_STRJI|nr:helix-turn-helix domain-containing protein [Streptacidiphilus jiangxiensis]SEL47214.1 DNA-binding transcriptional regulator, IclR family [Streptacidiphilus jiangxiensis]
MPASSSSAVDKALDLIEAVAGSDRPLRLAEIADRVGLHRGTAYRVLVDLVRRGWVMRVGDHYLPGTAVLRLSRSAAATSLAGVSRPVLEELAQGTGMMVNLQVLAADRARVVDVVRPNRLEMISDLRDELLPVHRFAGPLALVAALAPEARAPYLGPARADGYQMEGPDGLLDALDRAAATGFAVQRGRAERLIASVGRAVRPTPDAPPVCAITLVGPVGEFDDEGLTALERRLREATDRLGDELLRLTAPGATATRLGSDASAEGNA